MSFYVEQLRREAAEQHLANQLKAEVIASKLRQQVRSTKPLTEQITELMLSLAPALRERPWNMTDLVNRLQGKYRARPHPQMVGEALRKLNWKRQRVWSKGFDGVRLWMPPTLAE
jgi:hypothetical protein